MIEPAWPVAGGRRPTGFHSFFVVDVVSFSDASRSDSIRDRVRKALYEGLDRSLRAVGLRLDDCYHEDRGDGVMVLVSPETKTELLLTTVLDQLRAAVRHHNEASSEPAQMRLRVAVHVGEAESDGRGIVSTALTHTFRLLDSEPLRAAVRAADTGLAMVVSQRVYDDVVRHGRGAVDPGDYYRVDVRVKETVDIAWIMVPGARPARPDPPGTAVAQPVRQSPREPDPEVAVPLDGVPFAVLFAVVDDLLDIPRLRTPRGRDQVVGALARDIAGAIPRSEEARADLIAILQTCLDYYGGLQQLLQAIRGFVGESMAVRRLEQTIARLLAERPPGDIG